MISIVRLTSKLLMTLRIFLLQRTVVDWTTVADGHKSSAVRRLSRRVRDRSIKRNFT